MRVSGVALLSSSPCRLPWTSCSWYGAVHLESRALTDRELHVSALCDEVFSRGSNHLKNVFDLRSLPELSHSFPEVCFVGHTNCGKSRLIGALCHNYRMGKPSRNAGGTRSLKFFNVGDCLLLVDTPGYGIWKGMMPQKRAVQAAALAVTKQYLCVRRNAALKQLYWCFASGAPIRPRDVEFGAFLLREKIPFSVLLTKADRHKHEPALLEHHAKRIYRLLGTDVPLLDVSASTMKNIDALQRDIIFRCTGELRDTELTVSYMQRLGYSPPSAAEQIAAERAYPPQNEVLPPNDWLSIDDYIKRHESEKAAFLASHPDALACIPPNETEGGASVPRLPAGEDTASSLRALGCGEGAEGTSTTGECAPHGAVLGVPSEQRKLVVGSPQLPPTMVPNSVIDRQAALEGSQERYRSVVEHGWKEVVKDSYEPFFEHSTPRKSLSQKCIRKYLDVERKERSLLLNAAGHMCPWLDGSGSGNTVLGGAVKSFSNRAGPMRGIKQPGFITGRNVTANFNRGTGRATPKKFPWAT